MIKTIQICTITFIIVSNVGCNKQVSNNFLNIKDQLSKTITCELSDLADSISYINIETNNDCLLPSNISLLYIDNEDVFIRGGNYLYRFDQNGFFKNKIGQVGGGPKEYPQLYDADVDFNKKIVLLLASPGNVYVYDYEGSFVKKIELNTNSQAISFIHDNTFACVVNQYQDKFSTFLNLYNYNGELLQQQNLENDYNNFYRSMQSVPILYKTNDTLKIKFLYNDTIFKFTDKDFFVSNILFTGKYCPYRELIENMNKKADLMNNYIQIVDIVETDGYMFLLSIWKGKILGMVYNKKSYSFLYSNYIDNPKQGGGIENDLSNFSNFWPMLAIKGGKDIAQLIFPQDAGLTNLSIDSNPIIQIVHLK